MKLSVLAACAATVLLLLTAGSISAETKVQANDFVDLFEKLGGKHPGYRKAHARGVCAAGTFTPAQSDHFHDAELLTQGELPVVLRFSVGGGSPESDERSPGTRGVGLQLKLRDGAVHNFTGNNFPVFAGKDPDTFYGFLSTFLPDENGNRDPARTIAYIEQHPSVRANAAWRQTAQTAASYANTEFFGIHTFFYEMGSPEQIKFRWHLEPALGVVTLTNEEAEQLPDGFLEPTLVRQIETGTVAYNLYASIGNERDSTIDPSQQWPEGREKVMLGTVTLVASGGDACTHINFDPNVMSDAFSPSEDPVLKMRSPAYAISFGKRLSNQ